MARASSSGVQPRSIGRPPLASPLPGLSPPRPLTSPGVVVVLPEDLLSLDFLSSPATTDRRLALILLSFDEDLAALSTRVHILQHGPTVLAHMASLSMKISPPSMEATAAVKLNVAGAAEQERNIEHRCYLQPPSKEAQEIEDATATLLNLAQAPVAELNSPRCYMDLLPMGVMCRHKGGELVLIWDAQFKFKGLLEVTTSKMALYRARATAAGSSSQEMSQVIKITKYAGDMSFTIEYVSKFELCQLMLKAAEHPLPAWCTCLLNC